VRQLRGKHSLCKDKSSSVGDVVPFLAAILFCALSNRYWKSIFLNRETVSGMSRYLTGKKALAVGKLHMVSLSFI
jgi:hypothetical protein